jgi:flavin reductase (DIM6/NTAB) family NADH-FMN oxidoreductase RutF
MSDRKTVSLFNELEKEIFLVSSGANGQYSGMIVTWVTAASLVPEHPRIVLVLSPANATTQMLLHTGRFILHRLSREQVDLVPRFGLGSSARVDKFASVPFHLDDHQLPILEGVSGWARGTLVSVLNGGDRLVVLASIDQEGADPTKAPLCVHDLPEHLSPALMAQLEEKYVRDVERDRQLLHATRPAE